MEYHERGLRESYWDLWHMLRKMKKKDPLRPAVRSDLQRIQEAMDAAGIAPGKDGFNDGNRGPNVTFVCRHGQFVNHLCPKC